MKRFLSMALCIVMALGILSGCGQKTNDTPKNDDNSTALSGSVSTNGSTSMDKVIGALKEQFTADNPGVTVTYDPTGSGAGIEAVKNGSADIGLASRALKDQEKSAGLQETTVALDGIAIIINADSKVADLTVAQIADICAVPHQRADGADILLHESGDAGPSGAKPHRQGGDPAAWF